MQDTLSGPVTTAFSADVEPPFKVVIAYEDFEAGKSAKRTYDYVVAHAGADGEFRSEMWKFDVLGLPKLRELAVRDAREADLVIISSRGGPLPPQVRLWLDSSFKNDARPIALVSLSSGNYQESWLVHQHLAQVASQNGIEFFCQPDIQVEPDSEEHASHRARATETGERALSTLSNVLRREAIESVPRWGLNE